MELDTSHGSLGKIALKIYPAALKDGRSVSFREAFLLASEFMEEAAKWNPIANVWTREK